MNNVVGQCILLCPQAYKKCVHLTNIELHSPQTPVGSVDEITLLQCGFNSAFSALFNANDKSFARKEHVPLSRPI